MRIIDRLENRAQQAGIAIVTLALLLSSSLCAASKIDVYFGSAGKHSSGIYHSVLDTITGKLSPTKKVADIAAAPFITMSMDKRFLYAVALHGENREAVVAAFEVENDGNLALLNVEPIDDRPGTHIAIHPSGRFLITAQYSGSSVAVFPITANGRIGPRSQLIKHDKPSGVVPSRQKAPHPHWVGFSPDQRFAFVPDLGKDQIVIYRVDAENVSLEYHGVAQSIAGGGPRHMRFSQNGKFIYLLNELTLSVSTFAYDEKHGTAKLLYTSPTLSEEVKAKEQFNSASEILVHPSDNFVYTGNRGHDSITVFKANEQTGQLKPIEVEAIRGSWPRNINMDPSGKWLLAGGAKSNTVTVFSINPDSGELTFQLDGSIDVPEPISIVFGAEQH